MAQDGPHFLIVVETYYHPPTSGYRGGTRARPVPGERFPATMNVECGRSFRAQHPIGTKFKMRVKLTDREGGQKFLIADTQAGYEIVS